MSYISAALLGIAVGEFAAFCFFLYKNRELKKQHEKDIAEYVSKIKGITDMSSVIQYSKGASKGAQNISGMVGQQGDPEREEIIARSKIDRKAAIKATKEKVC